MATSTSLEKAGKESTRASKQAKAVKQEERRNRPNSNARNHAMGYAMAYIPCTRQIVRRRPRRDPPQRQSDIDRKRNQDGEESPSWRYPVRVRTQHQE